MFNELNNLKFFSLKKLCKELNISFSNTEKKEELLMKINQAVNMQPASLDTIEKFLKTTKTIKQTESKPEKTPTAPTINKPIHLGTIELSNVPNVSFEKIRIDKIIDDCNAILIKGMASARYNPDTQCIEFRGGAKKAVDVTIHQPDQTIYKLASNYVQRVIVNEGGIEGKKLQVSQSDLDLLAELKGLDIRTIKNMLQGQKLTYNGN